MPETVEASTGSSCGSSPKVLPVTVTDSVIGADLSGMLSRMTAARTTKIQAMIKGRFMATVGAGDSADRRGFRSASHLRQPLSRQPHSARCSLQILGKLTCRCESLRASLAGVDDVAIQSLPLFE